MGGINWKCKCHVVHMVSRNSDGYLFGEPIKSNSMKDKKFTRMSGTREAVLVNKITGEKEVFKCNSKAEFEKIIKALKDN